jgi:thiamine biosynthesis lipoprotein
MNELSLRKPLFGKEVVILVRDVDPRLAGGLLEDAYLRGLELQKIFNFFDGASMLSVLNRKRRLKVSADFLKVLLAALELCAKTDGRYDISLGMQFLQRKKGEALRPVGCTYKDILINDNTVELSHPDVMIDLGSIAKGYIADEIAAALQSEGVVSGLIDARGDIRVFGEDESVIGIQHPRDSKKTICSISLANGGVATSGDYNQYDGSYERPHILNNEHISVTVIAPSLMEADGYATAIFVTPAEQIAGLLAGSRIKAFCMNKELETITYNDFERCILK